MYVQYNEFKEHIRWVPEWYNEDVHFNVSKFLPENRLQAVKLMKDVAKSVDGENALGLKECKDIVDSLYSLIKRQEQIQVAYNEELSTFIDPNQFEMISLAHLKAVAKTTFPNWYNEEFHTKVVTLIEQENKLQACKLIVDTSKAHNTREKGYDLKWAKMEVCDVISELIKNVPMQKIIDRAVSLINNENEYPNITGLGDLLSYVPKKELLKFIENNS